MYDQYARQLIDLLPDLPNLDRDECRRALSAAYFQVVRSRLAIEQSNLIEGELELIQPLLRRMADALESIAVFDPLHGQERSKEVENACAFVAAEAIALLSKTTPSTLGWTSGDPLLDETNYLAIEAALLYMIGGYDVNAVEAVKAVKSDHLFSTTGLDQTITIRLTRATYVLRRVLALCRGEVRRLADNVATVSTDDDPTVPVQYEGILDDVHSKFYVRIGTAVDAYLGWLGGYEDAGLRNAIALLESIRNISTNSGYPGHTAFADIYHLSSLLLTAIDRTSQRSLLHKVPTPPAGDEAATKDFSAYLLRRCRGDEKNRGRPFLWPSALEYIQACLPGPKASAVVTMPTGSGKSFIAELAVVNALQNGWVLYIAPTNALVHQIRNDLEQALQGLSGASFRSFVGADEYTRLEGEQISPSDKRFVAVMTPEKCALAMRLHPERFVDCSLCVFDECHLLNDQHRGINADILLAQLSIFAPKIRVLLMSAMVNNPDELADWLGTILNQSAIPIAIKWRPTRSMRGLLICDAESLKTNYEAAKKVLHNLPPYRKNQPLDVSLALVAGLSGAWTTEGPPDYRVTRLPIVFEVAVSRGKAGPQFGSWKNAASRLLAEAFARAGIPTICFILSSRHHAFSSADKVRGVVPDVIGPSGVFPGLVEAWLSISDSELGVTTVMRDLLRHGIAVHTSAMLQTEQAAAEWMFSHEKAKLIFATGTLAQGLNLPAVAVVIAGTSMGDPRAVDIDSPAGISRVNALILNGFGRAGRPGFSNQGIGVLVPDSPFSAPISDDLDPVEALKAYSVLGEPDATVSVQSPLESFIDKLLASEPLKSAASEEELVLASSLAEFNDDSNNAGLVLSRTFAAYCKRETFLPQTPEQLRTRLVELKEANLQHPDMPQWMNTVAMKAGVQFLRAWQMYSAYMQRGVPSEDEAAQFGVMEWLQVFFEVMSLMPPEQIAVYLPDESVKRVTVLTQMRDRVPRDPLANTIPWHIPADWPGLWRELMELVSLYMKGGAYAELARVYLHLPAGDISNQRTKGDHPIPAAFKFLNEILSKLSVDAGCFLAIHEFVANDANKTEATVPDTLQALPLCIRNGCDSLGVLAWYRFAYRQRVCAHALQRAFPVPENLKTDAEIRAWVSQARRAWLAGEHDISDEPLLAHARVVITEASQN